MIKNRIATLLLLFASIFLFNMGSPVNAAEFPLSAVPDPLKTWVPWVLDGVPQAACPQTGEDNDNRRCVWPGLLELKVTAKGAQFSQEWHVYSESWVSLPGDADQWPQDVLVDGNAVAVIGRDQQPVLKLGRGVHKISGTFEWNSMPESLHLAADTGLLKLELAGQAVAQPVRDDDNTLWLQRKVDSASDDQVQLRIFRKVMDGVPIKVDTLLHLDISGKGREINVARFLLPEFIPQDLQSVLPATIKPDGSLSIQARAGSWDIRLTARHPAAVKSLTLGKPATRDEGLIADEEVWVFEAQPYIRTTAIEGPASVDPQQTLLPAEWRSLPAYMMQADTAFNFKEIRRGDSDPAPDKLSLQRRLWLSFDGSVLSISDAITGDINRSSRLSMSEIAQLGRVGMAGQDRVITRGNDKLAGVEVGRGSITLDADSTIALRSHQLPAVTWRQDFDRLAMELNLPAGWRLLYAGGADRADGAWLTRWNLLDFFVVLITALAAGQLWGRKWGVLALLTLILSYHESGAPRYLWMTVFAFAAIARALPAGGFKLWMRRFERTSLLVLVVTSLVFATSQVRSALYPVLESDAPGFYNLVDNSVMSTARRQVAQQEYDKSADAAVPPPPPVAGGQNAAPAAVEPVQMAEQQVRPLAKMDAPVDKYRMNSVKSKMGVRSSNYTNFDPDAKVQTGPGLPAWQWRRYQLVFDGPVRQDQQLDLWLLPPWAVKLLVVIRLLLLGILLACVAGMFRKPDDDDASGASGKKDLQGLLGMRKWPLLGNRTATTASVVLLAVFVAAGLISQPVQAQTPSNEQLEELKNKLTRPADCLPSCGEISRLLVQISGNSVRLGLEVDAAADTSLALPGGAKSWQPVEARIDGKPAFVHRGEHGDLWLLAPAGKHRVELTGSLLQADTLQLPLPHKPRKVDVRAEGWDVAGLSDDSGVADTLQLSRKVKTGKQAEKPALPSFLQIERRLVLDKEWQVFTTVTRLSPAGVPVLLQVPLLAGEAVTTSGMNIKDGKLEVNLGPQARSVEWRSSLPQSAQVNLQASQQSDWVESWVVSATSIWHVGTSGIPPAASDVGSGGDLQFYPWPGESLKLAIERPVAIPGQTMTIDDSHLIVSPGARASDYLLRIKLRSSRGGDYSISLPPEAILQKVSINQQARPIRANGRQLVLPVVPGVQQIEVSWRLDQGMHSSFSTVAANLGMASVNNWLELKMPHDRWLLMASGPGLGPAILFWGKLIVMLAVALLLGRFGGLPLRSSQWLLLALGLTQVDWWGAVLVIAWFYACKLRNEPDHPERPRWQFNLYQLAFVVLTLIMLSVLLESVRAGLLGQPDMQVTGNGSYAELLRWYVDRAAADLQTAWIFSLPILVYRGLMLLWALWLAWALLAWLKSGWQAFASGGLWKRKVQKPVVQEQQATE
ncbi:hypothetical protein [Undibacterium sp. TS12]|uniref:hypothetical protein n=1 Tax=Undibacterium sp. TS12 TaxID=2908202 RepID=UPI001F4CFA68|nr:hypothetical protein [Undibacterium sp. TS12]MCH8622360.1 hypothetical protein [Undibacterium sp. TS12]